MATLENIRKRGKLLAIVIGIALAAFLIGDLFNSGSSLLKSDQTAIAKVNGDLIEYNDYEAEIYRTEEFIKIREGSTNIDEQRTQQIRASVWDMMIKNKILEDSYDQLGLSISEAELEDLVMGKQVHQLVQQTFVDPKTGQFDKSIVVNVLKNLNKDPQLNSIWLYIENFIKQDRMYQKYITLASEGLYVTKLEAQSNDIEQNKLATLEIVGKEATSIPDSAISYTESEIEKYYNDHKMLYKNHEATCDLAYISFEVTPTKADSSETYNKAVQNKQIIASISDENLNGRYYSISDFSSLNLDSSVMQMPIDTIIGPYLSYGSYTISKIIAFQQRPDTVSARHILISPQNPNIKTIEKAQQVADSLITVLKNGGNFDILCLQYSDDPGSKEKGGLYEDFTDGYMVPEFNEFCFTKKVGDLDTIKTQFGIHIVEITKQSPLIKKVKLASEQYEINPSQATFNNIYTTAMTERGKMSNEAEFNTVATENNYTIKEANDINAGTYTIPGLDNVRELVKWAFAVEEGSISNVFEMNEKYIIATLLNKNEIGYLSLEKIKTKIENSVIQKKKIDKIYEEDFKNNKTTNLDELATKLKTQKQTIPNVAFNAFQLSNFGYEPAILAEITSIQQNKIKGPIKGNNGVYMIKAIKITEPPKITPEQLATQQATETNSLKSRADYQIYTALKTAANIVDRRANF